MRIGNGTVVVVTGSTAGIGRATAVAAGARRAKVACIARSELALRSVKEEIETAGGQCLTIAADVADSQAIEDAAERIEREMGEIDVWINNATVTVYSPIKDMTAEEYRRVTEVDYLGYVHGTLSALKRMLVRNRGVIVQVGSLLAYRSVPLQSAYCAAKHAIKGFTESLWSELLHDKSGVKVTMVQLPGINTPQFNWSVNKLGRRARPIPPVFQPEVAADAILYAAQTCPRELFVSAAVSRVMWLQKFAPGLVDRWMATNAYEGEQSDEPDNVPITRNLWRASEPSEHTTHGRFDEISKPTSPKLTIDKTRRFIAPILAVAGVAALVLPVMLRQRKAS